MFVLDVIIVYWEGKKHQQLVPCYVHPTANSARPLWNHELIWATYYSGWPTMHAYTRADGWADKKLINFTKWRVISGRLILVDKKARGNEINGGTLSRTIDPSQIAGLFFPRQIGIYFFSCDFPEKLPSNESSHHSEWMRLIQKQVQQKCLILIIETPSFTISFLGLFNSLLIYL